MVVDGGAGYGRCARATRGSGTLPRLELLVPSDGRPRPFSAHVPPSKSIDQRVRVLAALSGGSVQIQTRAAGPRGDDVLALGNALATLGPWSGSALGTSRVSRRLDLGEGATGFRCLLAVATLRPPGARTLVTGRPQLRRRRHRPLARALAGLGCLVTRRQSGAYRVFGAEPARRRSRVVVLPAEASSQYATALLLAAPRWGGVHVRFTGRVVSAPYLRLTVEVLRAFGVAVDVHEAEGAPQEIRVGAGEPRAAEFLVPPDMSSAVARYAAAALTGGQALVPGLGPTDRQADGALLPLLERFGATVDVASCGSWRVRGSSGPGRPLGEVELRDAPDLVPIVAALAAVAPGLTQIRGVAHARLKESDRLGAMARGLLAMGAEVREREDGLDIVGRPLAAATHSVKGDHRCAFAFALLGLVVPGTRLRGSESVRKSDPLFFEDVLYGLAARDG